jgi:large subunit ribosomal protein L3
MLSGYIAKKLQMTNRYSENGKRIPVTILKAQPLTVTQLRTEEKNGYSSVQVAYGSRLRLNKSVAAKLKKDKIEGSPKGFKEFQKKTEDNMEIGNQIKVENVFAIGDIVNVTATSKGRGFAGVIKRHGFHRQGVTRGQSDRTRAPGSIGAQTPGKVIKGKKMPGHLGNVTKTVSNLKVIDINSENNELTISGSVPGARNSWVVVTKQS